MMSYSSDYVHPDDQTQPFDMTPGFKPFTARHLFVALYLQFITSSNKNNRNLLSYNKSILHKPRLPYLIWINYYTMQDYQMLLANLEISEY